MGATISSSAACCCNYFFPEPVIFDGEGKCEKKRKPKKSSTAASATIDDLCPDDDVNVVKHVVLSFRNPMLVPEMKQPATEDGMTTDEEATVEQVKRRARAANHRKSSSELLAAQALAQWDAKKEGPSTTEKPKETLSPKETRSLENPAWKKPEFSEQVQNPSPAVSPMIVAGENTTSPPCCNGDHDGGGDSCSGDSC